MRAAPIGAASLLGVTAVSVCCVAFQLAQPLAMLAVRWAAAVFIIIAYLIFPPVLAGALYSLLFERPKSLGFAALDLAALSVLAMPSLQILDGILLLPFWFLAILGVVKFVRWRRYKGGTAS